jgi:hypothetical protein
LLTALVFYYISYFVPCTRRYPGGTPEAVRNDGAEVRVPVRTVPARPVSRRRRKCRCGRIDLLPPITIPGTEVGYLATKKAPAKAEPKKDDKTAKKSGCKTKK